MQNPKLTNVTGTNYTATSIPSNSNSNLAASLNSILNVITQTQENLDTKNTSMTNVSMSINEIIDNIKAGTLDTSHLRQLISLLENVLNDKDAVYGKEKKVDIRQLLQTAEGVLNNVTQTQNIILDSSNLDELLTSLENLAATLDNLSTDVATFALTANNEESSSKDKGSKASGIRNTYMDNTGANISVLNIALMAAIALMEMNYEAARIVTLTSQLYEKVLNDLSGMQSLMTSISSMYKTIMNQRQLDDEKQKPNSVVNWDDEFAWKYLNEAKQFSGSFLVPTYGNPSGVGEFYLGLSQGNLPDFMKPFALTTVENYYRYSFTDPEGKTYQISFPPYLGDDGNYYVDYGYPGSTEMVGKLQVDAKYANDDGLSSGDELKFYYPGTNQEGTRDIKKIEPWLSYTKVAPEGTYFLNKDTITAAMKEISVRLTMVLPQESASGGEYGSFYAQWGEKPFDNIGVDALNEQLASKVKTVNARQDSAASQVSIFDNGAQRGISFFQAIAQLVQGLNSKL